MISDKAIKSDIPAHDLIYGYIKEKLYDLSVELNGLPDDTSEDSAQYLELIARIDSYTDVYVEIERILLKRGYINLFDYPSFTE